MLKHVNHVTGIIANAHKDVYKVKAFVCVLYITCFMQVVTNTNGSAILLAFVRSRTGEAKQIKYRKLQTNRKCQLFSHTFKLYIPCIEF